MGHTDIAGRCDDDRLEERERDHHEVFFLSPSKQKVHEGLISVDGDIGIPPPPAVQVIHTSANTEGESNNAATNRFDQNNVLTQVVQCSDVMARVNSAPDLSCTALHGEEGHIPLRKADLSVPIQTSIAALPTNKRDSLNLYRHQGYPKEPKHGGDEGLLVEPTSIIRGSQHRRRTMDFFKQEHCTVEKQSSKQTRPRYKRRHTLDMASSGGFSGTGSLLRGCMTVTRLEDSLSKSTISKLRRRADLSVSFGTVNFRHYERIVGDNPSVTFGVPMSIGWAYVCDPDDSLITLDEYEASRPYPRLDRGGLAVSSSKREELLKCQWGFSRSEMDKARKVVSVAKNQRKKTNERIRLDPVERFAESVVRKLGSIVRRKSKRKEEEKLWENAERFALEKSLSSTVNSTGPTKSIVASEEDE